MPIRPKNCEEWEDTMSSVVVSVPFIGMWVSATTHAKEFDQN